MPISTFRPNGFPRCLPAGLVRWFCSRKSSVFILSLIILLPLSGLLPAHAEGSAPVMTVPDQQAVPGGTVLIFSEAENNPIQVRDPEGDRIRLGIQANCGVLTVSGTTGIDITGRDTAHLILSGPEADINRELNGLRFTPFSSESRLCRLDLTAEDQTEAAGVTFAQIHVLFFAPGGPDLFAEEGKTVTLTALPADAADIVWRQTAGRAVGLSDAGAAAPTFVSPPVNTGFEDFSFSASYVLENSPAAAAVTVRIVDNGISSLPPDVTSFYTSDFLEMGIRLSSGHLTELSALPADTVSTDNHRPASLPFGLVSFVVATPRAGDRITVEFFLPWAASEDEAWYKYDAYSGWYPLDDAEFSDDRTRVRISLADGGSGDADFAVNGRISDPSALGAPPENSTAPETAPGDCGSGDGGGCFLGRMRVMLEQLGK